MTACLKFVKLRCNSYLFNILCLQAQLLRSSFRCTKRRDSRMVQEPLHAVVVCLQSVGASIMIVHQQCLVVLYVCIASVNEDNVVLFSGAMEQIVWLQSRTYISNSVCYGMDAYVACDTTMTQAFITSQTVSPFLGSQV